MTIEEVLAQVDELKPNQYSDTIKVSWLSKLDQKIWIEVISRYVKETDTSASDSDTDTTSDDESTVSAQSDDETSTSGDDTTTSDDTTSTDTTTDTTTTTTDDTEETDTDSDTFNGYTIYDTSETLLVDDAYADLYVDYCFAMIDYNNQELDRYANSMLMFNSKYQDYKNYYNRTHTIKSNPLKVW